MGWALVVWAVAFCGGFVGTQAGVAMGLRDRDVLRFWALAGFWMSMVPALGFVLQLPPAGGLVSITRADVLGLGQVLGRLLAASVVALLAFAGVAWGLGELLAVEKLGEVTAAHDLERTCASPAGAACLESMLDLLDTATPFDLGEPPLRDLVDGRLRSSPLRRHRERMVAARSSVPTTSHSAVSTPDGPVERRRTQVPTGMPSRMTGASVDSGAPEQASQVTSRSIGGPQRWLRQNQRPWALSRASSSSQA